MKTSNGVYFSPGLYTNYRAPYHVLVFFYILLCILMILYIGASIKHVREKRLLSEDRMALYLSQRNTNTMDLTSKGTRRS